MTTPRLSLNQRLRKSPFEERSHVGATLASVYNHVVLPSVYASLEEDYWHLREHVQIWDVACQVQVEVQGPDALALMEYLTPRDLSQIVPGQCVYAPLIDADAGIVNDPIILCLAPDRFWLSISDSDVLLWVKGLATGAGFNVRVFDPDVFPVSIQGPKSDLLLSRLIDTPTEDIRRFRFIEAKIADTDLIIARTGWSGQGGFEFYLAESAKGVDLWDTIVGAATDLNLRSGCPNLIDRIETGLLSHGNDMTFSNNPIEAGLDRFFQLGKDSDYLGRQALEKIASAGPSQRMVRIMVPGSGITNPREIYPMTVSGSEQPGSVTSICHSPRMRCHVGFAYAPADSCSPGTRITISTPAGDAEGQIADEHWRVDASDHSVG